VIDIVTSTRNKKLVFSRQPMSPTQRWKAFPIENPHGIPHGKAVAIADINGDRRLDLVHDTNTDGKRHAPGLFWTSYVKSPTDTHWTVHDVSGTEGVKFDLIQVLDLDADGDLDILTCEERDNLAVFWYENPACQATR